jgi:hypothetical protein
LRQRSSIESARVFARLAAAVMAITARRVFSERTFDRFVLAITSAREANGYSIMVTSRNGPASHRETAMTTRSTLTKFTLLTATLVTSMALLSATNGAQARDYDGHGHSGYGDRDRDHDRDRDRDYDRDHDRDRDYDRDHDRDRDRDHDRDDPILVHHHGPNPGSIPTPIVVVRDHRGAGFAGNVRDHRGLDGAPGGVTVSGSGFQGNVRDHR